MTVRVRFAPSPTGHLHVGGARTALFNWLYARQNEGVFVLRIEDTDSARSRSEMVDSIQQDLCWLGLDWDEGPYYQSERFDLYASFCKQLLENKKAYRCFCSRSEPATLPLNTHSTSVRHCEGFCSALPESTARERVQAKESFTLRLEVPKGRKVGFEDGALGFVQVETDEIKDFVLMRSDGTPTYHLAVVADDIDMRISHVIRGADHLSNTSKHILIYEALRVSPPSFVHLPLILGQDRKRLSKRHGANSVSQYKKEGFLPTALNNYLALLGWSPGTDQEFFTQQELVASFASHRINKSNAIFDPVKLEWMNSQHISRLPADMLALEVKPFLQAHGLWRSWFEEEGGSVFLQTIDLLKNHLTRLHEIVFLGKPFFVDQFEYDSPAVERYLSFSEQPNDVGVLCEAIEELRQSYASLKSFDLEQTEKLLRQIAHSRGLKTGAFIGAVRVALTGKMVAPGIFEVIVALGKKRTVERLERLLEFLQ